MDLILGEVGSQIGFKTGNEESNVYLKDCLATLERISRGTRLKSN